MEQFQGGRRSFDGIAVGGLLTGLSNDDAARYSFLLSTPAIGLSAISVTPVSV